MELGIKKDVMRPSALDEQDDESMTRSPTAVKSASSHAVTKVLPVGPT